jgi:HEAT repeat protein
MDEVIENNNFKELIGALLDSNHPFPPKYLHSFSDISSANLEAIKKIWAKVDPIRRIALVEDLEPLLEADTLLCFDDFAQFAIGDPEASVRSHAIQLLWESEDSHLIPILCYLLQHDPSDEVRAAAASGLGKFVFLGEEEEIPANLLKEIEELLLDVMQTSKINEVQRKALEALGYSSRKEVASLINKAFQKKDTRWLSSALFAMGRSADRQWENQVLEMIDHHDEDVIIEAIRAAGELELVNARETLIEKATNDAGIWEVRAASIWSLSKIGGEDARDTLEDLLEKAEDEEEADIIEEALENLSFTDDQHNFGINLSITYQ